MRMVATVRLVKEIILASIDAQTFKRVDGVLSAESDQIKNAISSDSTETLDKHILHEHMEQRDAILRQRLSFCLKELDYYIGNELVATNILETEMPFFEYKMSVPEGFDGQRLRTLAKKMHNYIVQGTLHDWYATQNMKGNVSKDELDEIEKEIVCMLRSSFVKRPLQPFGPQK